METPCLPSVIDRFRLALNLHDAGMLAECLHAEFVNTQPAHPERNARGKIAAALRWAHTFECVPDLRANLLRYACANGLVWTEWTFTSGENGSYRAGGVVIFAVCHNLIVWARTYTEAQPIEGPDWESAIAEALRFGDDQPVEQTGDSSDQHEV